MAKEWQSLNDLRPESYCRYCYVHARREYHSEGRTCFRVPGECRSNKRDTWLKGFTKVSHEPSHWLHALHEMTNPTEQNKRNKWQQLGHCKQATGKRLAVEAAESANILSAEGKLCSHARPISGLTLDENTRRKALKGGTSFSGVLTRGIPTSNGLQPTSSGAPTNAD